MEYYADLSRETGANIVACSGFWAERKILPFFQLRDLDELTELFVHEVTVGMGATNIPAGIIKVGTSREGMTACEERTFRAAARAHRQTGVAVTTHGTPTVERQAEIFLEEGVDPRRIVIGHLDDKPTLDIERDKRLARQGFNLGYDRVGIGPEWSPMYYAISDQERADYVQAIVDAGYLEHVVVAGDTNGWTCGLSNRGTPQATFAHLMRAWPPLLRGRGFSDAQIETMLVETPRRILAF